MTLLCLLWVLALPGPALAKTAGTTTGAPVIAATGAFFALSVADVDASAEWYREKLGLKVVMKTPMTGGAAVIVLEGQGLIVELVQHDGAVPLSKAAPTVKGRLFVHGLAKAGVMVTDFEGTIGRLKQRGARILYGPFPAKEGQRANVILEDDSGNLIQIFGQ